MVVVICGSNNKLDGELRERNLVKVVQLIIFNILKWFFIYHLALVNIINCF